MNKLGKLLIGFILFQIITISSNNLIILPESTYTQTCITPPIKTNSDIRYIIMDNEEKYIIYFSF